MKYIATKNCDEVTKKCRWTVERFQGYTVTDDSIIIDTKENTVLGNAGDDGDKLLTLAKVAAEACSEQETPVATQSSAFCKLCNLHQLLSHPLLLGALIPAAVFGLLTSLIIIPAWWANLITTNF